MTLKQLRQERNLTQEDVAKLTGLTSRYISMIETGCRIPSDRVKSKLAKVYQKKVEDIFLICWEHKVQLKIKRMKHVTMILVSI